MQTDVAETIYDLVKILPETKQRKVLSFVNDLRSEENMPLVDMLQEIESRGQSIPDDYWEEVPPDGSLNHDHYLYGSKKR